MRRARLPGLPNGRLDLLRQLVVFCGAYWAYRLVRSVVVDDPAAAFEHARRLVELERATGLYSEPAVHAWARSVPWLIDAASWMYVNSHFVITTLTLAWVYLCRNPAFYFVRNMFTVAMGLALVLYVVYPTAPPRLMPELGYTDSVAAFTGVPESASGLLVNPYAAVPSMHVAFALMLAASAVRLTRRRWVRAAWLAYPPVVCFAVVATANHWWADAVAGALVAAVAAAAAHVLAARRPHAWAFRPVSAPAAR
jgi:hypothetical protein